ncbi:MAG: SprT family zinc-dependent metalloprotease [Thalassobaculales bacterium]
MARAGRTLSRRPEALEAGGLAVALRVSARARRLILRLDPLGRAVLVVPQGVSLAEARAFLDRNAGWLAVRRQRTPAGIALVAGAVLPYRGEPHRIDSRPAQRPPVLLEPGVIAVGGDPAFLARRLGDWLRARAREALGEAVRRHAAALGRPLRRISLRDTSSRWGSCSSAGDISLSWRLILAPPAVLDYVCAHEAAHLAEHNHGPRFWQLVAGLVGDPAPMRAWLKANGASLLRVGVSAAPPPGA